MEVTVRRRRRKTMGSEVGIILLLLCVVGVHSNDLYCSVNRHGTKDCSKMGIRWEEKQRVESGRTRYGVEETATYELTNSPQGHLSVVLPFKAPKGDIWVTGFRLGFLRDDGTRVGVGESWLEVHHVLVEDVLSAGLFCPGEVAAVLSWAKDSKDFKIPEGYGVPRYAKSEWVGAFMIQPVHNKRHGEHLTIYYELDFITMHSGENVLPVHKAYLAAYSCATAYQTRQYEDFTFASPGDGYFALILAHSHGGGIELVIDNQVVYLWDPAFNETSHITIGREDEDLQRRFSITKDSLITIRSRYNNALPEGAMAQFGAFIYLGQDFQRLRNTGTRAFKYQSPDRQRRNYVFERPKIKPSVPSFLNSTEYRDGKGAKYT